MKLLGWVRNLFSQKISVTFTSDPIRLEYKKISESAKLPFRKRETDAGWDLYSTVEMLVPAHGTATINTGIIISSPPGWHYTIEGRSGLGMNGIVPFRGIIDSSYTGEVLVQMINNTNSPYHIQIGDRIAQIILHKTVPVEFVEVDEFSPEYNLRGTAGFGASGR